MAKDEKRERWTFDYHNLRWYRDDSNNRRIYQDSWEGRQADTSTVNIFKQYQWILENCEGDKHLSKNTIVKRIPALWNETTKKTRNSLDGRLRSILGKVRELEKEHKVPAKDRTEDLTWWKPQSEKVLKKKEKKSEEDRLKSLLGL
jgi:hypothetical protein